MYKDFIEGAIVFLNKFIYDRIAAGGSLVYDEFGTRQPFWRTSGGRGDWLAGARGARTSLWGEWTILYGITFHFTLQGRAMIQ